MENEGEEGDSAIVARWEMTGMDKQGFHRFRLQRYAIFLEPMLGKNVNLQNVQ